MTLSDSTIVINFAEARQPEYRERKGMGYVEFGEYNDYPNYLLNLYNKSAKHNAIVRGKVNYIIGNGWKGEETDAAAQSFIESPNRYETLADLTRKVSIDVEVFGGAYLSVVWSAIGGQLASVSHVDYTRVRTSSDNTSYWYKKDWEDRKEKARVIPAFNTQQREGEQILYLKEYRPGLDAYALPGYMGALNYIESDIKVSEHVLGNAQTGFSASKLITLPNGEPSDDQKRVIDRRFRDNFSGADGKKFILHFATDTSRKPIIDDLGASDLTKEDFGRVDEMIQANIFAGHQITAPTLFGIAEPGKLGSRTEMRDAYEIFKNTYVNDKQHALESVFNRLAELRGATSEITIVPLEPIEFEFTETTIAQNMTKDEIRERLNLAPMQTQAPSQAQIVSDSISALSPLVANEVLKSMSQDEIRALVGLPSTQATPGAVGGAGAPANVQAEASYVNDHIKGMTGRQWQQMARIIREFTKGRISREQAAMMLRSGFGLTEEELITMLGTDEAFGSQEPDMDEVLETFMEFGEHREAFDVVRTGPLQFFRNEVTNEKDKRILEVVRKYPLTPAADIAKAVRVSVDEVEDRIASLVDTKVLRRGRDGGLTPTAPISQLVDEPTSYAFEVRYSYEWKPEVPSSQRDTPEHPSRPFCKKLMQLDRFYTRKEIEAISARLGYSVFDRGGGWWGQGPGVPASPSCRHEWRSNVLIRKKRGR